MNHTFLCLQGVPKWGVFWEFSPHNPVFFSERPKDRLWQACWDCPYLHYLPPILRPQSSAAPPPMCNHVTQCVIMLLRRVAIYHRGGGEGWGTKIRPKSGSSFRRRGEFGRQVDRSHHQSSQSAPHHQSSLHQESQ